MDWSPRRRPPIDVQEARRQATAVVEQPTRSAEDCFLALSVRSYGREGAKGRIDALGTRPGNGRYLRIAVARVSAANVRFLANAEQVRRSGLTLVFRAVGGAAETGPARGARGSAPP
jgi:hypothetical protein